MAQDQEDILRTLTNLQGETLSIIRLGEPIAASKSATRTSDVSTSSIAENPTPASLEADLNHYKELFSKLRFSYLEQVTKEKFLRAIVGEPPLIVDHQENVELEVQLAEVKSVLKAQKEHVSSVVKELEDKGRGLSRRRLFPHFWHQVWGFIDRGVAISGHETISLQTTLLTELPSQITSLNETLASFHEQLAAQSTGTKDSESLSLPLPATRSLLTERQQQLSNIEKEIKAIQQALPAKGRRLDVEERELKTLEKEKNGKVEQAREAKRRREGGEGGGNIELKGKWLRGVHTGLTNMLGVEAEA